LAPNTIETNKVLLLSVANKALQRMLKTFSDFAMFLWQIWTCLKTVTNSFEIQGNPSLVQIEVPTAL
jgi:hypothetical protein